VAVTPLQIVLLIVCWMTALVTLVIFLESWFALTRRTRLAPSASASESGVVTVLVPLRGEREAMRKTVLSILGQSYPFIELVLIYCERESAQLGVVREFSAMRSEVSVRPFRVPFSLEAEPDRIRALEQAHPGTRGAWILVVEPDVVLEPHAVGSALEFAREKDLTALGLAPGVECRSFGQRLVAPSLEWFVRMMRVVDRGRERSRRFQATPEFSLFHGDTHSVINRMNRMPGILNESGWTLWSYRVEGLRTYQGDGSGWIFREATARSLLSRIRSESPAPSGRRTLSFLLGSASIAFLSVTGVIFGLFGDADSLATHGILYLSSFSYSLMATSYFLYARRLKAAAWFAPLWFLAHGQALLLVAGEISRSRWPSAPDVAALSGRNSEVSTRK
jgi:hypothetical protein